MRFRAARCFPACTVISYERDVPMCRSECASGAKRQVPHTHTHQHIMLFEWCRKEDLLEVCKGDMLSRALRRVGLLLRHACDEEARYDCALGLTSSSNF